MSKHAAMQWADLVRGDPDMADPAADILTVAAVATIEPRPAWWHPEEPDAYAESEWLMFGADIGMPLQEGHLAITCLERAGLSSHSRTWRTERRKKAKLAQRGARAKTKGPAASKVYADKFRPSKRYEQPGGSFSPGRDGPADNPAGASD